MRTAIVTLLLGRPYQLAWHDLCEPGWRAYADRHGFEMIAIERPLDITPRAMARSLAWQKCLVLQPSIVGGYDRVVAHFEPAHAAGDSAIFAAANASAIVVSLTALAEPRSFAGPRRACEFPTSSSTPSRGGGGSDRCRTTGKCRGFPGACGGSRRAARGRSRASVPGLRIPPDFG